MTPKEFSEVLAFLEETPEIFRRRANDFTSASLRRKPAEDAFSLLEHACHLRDIEREGYGARIRRMLEENEPSLADLDGASLARERNYNSQDFDAALSDFTRARQENLSLVRTLSADQLSRRGRLEGVGAITIDGLLLLMRDHDESHRKELSDFSVTSPARGF